MFLACKSDIFFTVVRLDFILYSVQSQTISNLRIHNDSALIVVFEFIVIRQLHK